MKYLIFSIFLALGMIACKQNNSHSSGSESTEVSESGPEYTSKYICPMHCKGSGSDEAGQCPACGMDYVLNEDFKEDNGHDHSDHEGHNH